mmetsp:Transcript_20737/g.64310  ORF Transcript_20737/g.64310 Transcript_20737/m.64310 type:complete len:291 (-) Transcript_20737:280-1152(-)
MFSYVTCARSYFLVAPCSLLLGLSDHAHGAAARHAPPTPPTTLPPSATARLSRSNTSPASSLTRSPSPSPSASSPAGAPRRGGRTYSTREARLQPLPSERSYLRTPSTLASSSMASALAWPRRAGAVVATVSSSSPTESTAARGCRSRTLSATCTTPPPQSAMDDGTRSPDAVVATAPPGVALSASAMTYRYRSLGLAPTRYATGSLPFLVTRRHCFSTRVAPPSPAAATSASAPPSPAPPCARRSAFTPASSRLSRASTCERSTTKAPSVRRRGSSPNAVVSMTASSPV